VLVSESRGGDSERVLVIACITNSELLGRIALKLPDNPFGSTACNVVFDLCRDHWRKYRQARS